MVVGRISLALFGLSAIANAQVNVKHIEFFEARIRPVLINKCYACHADNKLGGLRVDSRAGLLEGGKSGAAFVPGAPPAALCFPRSCGPARS